MSAVLPIRKGFCLIFNTLASTLSKCALFPFKPTFFLIERYTARCRKRVTHYHICVTVNLPCKYHYRVSHHVAGRSVALNYDIATSLSKAPDFDRYVYRCAHLAFKGLRRFLAIWISVFYSYLATALMAIAAATWKWTAQKIKLQYNFVVISLDSVVSASGGHFPCGPWTLIVYSVN